jgi:excisionase family DNA binding protein
MAYQSPLSIYGTPTLISTEPAHPRRGKLIAFVPEQLLDTEEAAAAMRIHPKTLQKLARRGRVRGIRVGKLWRFRASDIQDWIESQ